MVANYDTTAGDRPQPDDRQLIEEFKKTPIGHHSPDLQRLLNRMRGAPMADKYCVVVVKANRVWQLAKTNDVRGKPMKMLSKRFKKRADAEWYVFKRRWKALTGEALRD